jgi:hypothetical protein
VKRAQLKFSQQDPNQKRYFRDAFFALQISSFGNSVARVLQIKYQTTQHERVSSRYRHCDGEWHRIPSEETIFVVSCSGSIEFVRRCRFGEE